MVGNQLSAQLSHLDAQAYPARPYAEITAAALQATGDIKNIGLMKQLAQTLYGDERFIGWKIVARRGCVGIETKDGMDFSFDVIRTKTEDWTGEDAFGVCEGNQSKTSQRVASKPLFQATIPCNNLGEVSDKALEKLLNDIIVHERKMSEQVVAIA